MKRIFTDLFRRPLALVLAAALLAGLLPAAALAETTAPAVHSDGSACPAGGFSDVDPGQWYHEAVDYVLSAGMMNGTGAGLFEPDAGTSRAMIVTILHRMEGAPAPAAAGAFSDVSAGAWYADAVAWAAEKGIVQGYDGRFAPDDLISRQQLAAILYRYAQYKGYDVSAGEGTDLTGYPDAGTVAEYALSAMKWACGAGIINGSDGKLLPEGSARRCEAAAMMMRFGALAGEQTPETRPEDSEPGNIVIPGGVTPPAQTDPEDNDTPARPESGVSASVEVTTEGDVLTASAAYSGEGVEVTVPAGVKVESGRTRLPIRVTQKERSDSGLTAGADESLNAYDVHVEGLAADNTVPVLVKMAGVLPKNLNSSALKICHVENGQTVEMTYVPSDQPLTAHNQFHYDPATGDLTVAMASFSEVAVVVDNTNPWDGTADTSWYNETDAEFTIRNAQQLAGLAQVVASGDSFAGKTVRLAADIDLSGSIFYPIGFWAVENGESFGKYGGSFEGTFDGMGHTVSNLNQNGWEMKGEYTDSGYYNETMGLFGHVKDATIQNLNVDGFTTVMEFATTGCIAATAEGACTFKNIAVTNADMSSCNTAVAGIVGWDTGTNSQFVFENITVDNTNTFRSLWGIHDTVASGILGYLDTDSAASFTNCNVACVLDIYNDYVGAYQWGIYRYCGMFIGAVKKTTVDEETGRSICDLSNVTATGCTVNFGEWSESYYYCEFEKNGHPSYAGADDYRFSRVPLSEIVFDGNGNATGCTHEHSEVEDGRAWQFVFDAVFGSYGNWGVTTVGLAKYPAIQVSQITAGQEKFSVKFENTDKYLYRVGNANAVALSSLFEAISGAAINQSGVYVSVTRLDENTDVAGTFTANTDDWTQGTLKFTGTGPVKITIQDFDYCTPTELYLEVVDGKNVTQYSELSNGNCVLLSDIKMGSNGQYYLSNAALYGNGFTFDVTDGRYGNTANGSMANNYVICLKNATLDHVKIVGAVYTSYGATVKADYNFPIVLSTGNDTISNSYISNGAAPVRVNDANLIVENTILKGGNFANLDIRGGQVVLDNVTTINQVGLNDTANGTVVAGLGIVAYYENVLDTTTITVKNGIKQYNHLQESDANYIQDSQAKTLFNAMFSYADAIYTDGSGRKWVNTGIISMSSAVGDANISDIAGYIGIDTSLMGEKGFAYVPEPDAPETSVEEYAAVQGAIAPAYSFDYATKNYVPKTEGSNDYCYEDGGVVKISFDEGDTFAWDTSILTVEKNGQTLPYTVSMNGTDYTGKSIAFNTTGIYTVVYTYTDSHNYTMANGSVGMTDKTYEKTVTITVSAVKAAAKHAEFTFGSSNTAGTTKTIGDKTYVIPNVPAADNSTWGSITVGSDVVYYPIVEADVSDKKNAYFYVFKDIVTITDYADGGTGAAATYNSSTTTLPNGLTAVKGKYGEFTDLSSGWSVLNDSNLVQSGPTNIFKYASSTSADATPTTKDGALCYKSPDVGGNERVEYYTIVQYSYTDNAGSTYYYYVGYHMDKKGTCLTPDTLITLADGTRKEVQYIVPGEELLVWNFFTGTCDTAPVLFNDYEEQAEQEVIRLTFSDGTVVKVIYEHGFFDLDLGQYVYLDRSAAQYIGHRFDKSGESVELVDVELMNEVTTAWSPVTYGHLCYYANGLLSMPGGIEGMFNYFEVDVETMKYDEAAMEADIETYGLFTYEEFAAEVPVPEVMFDALGGKYLKISIGKGLVTMEELRVLANRYMTFFED